MAVASNAVLASFHHLFSRSIVSSSLSTTLSKPRAPWVMFGLISSSIAIPAISINIPGLLSDIWDGVLKAVPKKKTSHMKKRHRQLAGKALKDVKNVNTCPGCGRPKLSHTLCPYCVAEIQQSWQQRDEANAQTSQKT